MLPKAATISEGFKRRGSGTWERGLVVTLAVLREVLDLMILESFSNLNDSTVL